MIHRSTADRLTLLALMALVLAMPMAGAPPLADRLLMAMTGQPPGQWLYLPRPGDNQRSFLTLGVFGLAMLHALGRLVSTGADGLRRTTGSWVVPTALALFGAMLISAWTAEFPEIAFRALLSVAACAAAMVVAADLRPGRLPLEKLLLAAVVSGAVPAVIALMQSRGHDPLPYLAISGDNLTDDMAAKQRIGSTFGHPNHFGSYVAPLTVWAWYFALAPGRWRRLAGVAAGLPMAAAIVASGARGAILGMVAGAAVFLLLAVSARGPLARRRLLAWGLAGAVIAIVAGAFFVAGVMPVPRGLSSRLTATFEVVQRVYYWVVGWTMFAGHPLTGVGPGGFDRLFWDVSAAMRGALPDAAKFEFLLRDNARLARPVFMHNDHFQTLVEGGLLAGAAWCALWASMAREAWADAGSGAAGPKTAGRRDGLRPSSAVAGFMAAFAADGCFNFPMQLPASSLLFWLLLGLWPACLRAGGLRRE